MKSIKNHAKSISIALVTLLLFQSCRVYKWRGVSLDEAVKQKKRVKIKTQQGKILKYHKIVFKDGTYFGVKKVKRVFEEIPIDTENIQKLRLHDKFLSIVYGIGIGLTLGAVLVLAIALHDLNLDVGGNFIAPI